MWKWRQFKAETVNDHHSFKMDRKRGSRGRLLSHKKADLLLKRKLFLRRGSNNSVARELSSNLKQNIPTGKRIIDVAYFGQQFDQGCVICKFKFEFRDSVKETKFGFASFFHLMCRKCGAATKLATSTRSTQPNSSRRRSPFTVNVKAALAMIHAGVGETHMNAIFSIMGLPTISASSLKHRERDVGPALERSARESCNNATFEEVSLTCRGDNRESEGEQSSTPPTFDETLSLLEVCEDNYHGVCNTKIDDAASASQSTSGNATCIHDDIDDNRYEACLNEDKTEWSRDSSTGSSGSAQGSDHSLTCDEALAFLEESPADDNGHQINLCEAEVNQPQVLSVAGETENTELVNIAISQDAEWPKRGKGMNSLSGWANIIGTQTKKCLNYGTRNKACKMCSSNRKLGNSIPLHDCRVDWNKSAKAMEASIQVELHKNAMKEGVKYAKVIGDEDSSSIKHIRDEVNHDLEKYSDIHHIKRSMSRKLSEIHKTHKSLTEKVRNDFMKNFTYAVHQNNTKTESEMKTALQSITEHMFGNHDMCGSWCGYTRDPTNYRHTNLPYGKDLTDQLLKSKLNALLSTFVNNPQKLMTTGSTQPNESLNNVAWSKAPKTKNYTASESFDYRCAAAVLQFNEGVKYVDQVREKLNLSPRKETKEFLKRRDKKRNYHKEYKSEKKQKRRRIELKKERKNEDLTSEIKLGITYENDCLLDNTIDSLDTDVIPDPVIIKEHLPYEVIDQSTHVFIDLETNKLGYNAEIVQISACTETDEFNRYALPRAEIANKATEMTGIMVRAVNGQKRLIKDGNILDTVPVETALENFIDWLESLPGKKILIAHNGKRFDFPILCRQLKETNMMERATSAITGLADSLTMARKYVKGCGSYTLSSIHEFLFKCTFAAHDAKSDAKAVMKVFETLPNECLYRETEYFEVFSQNTQRRMNLRKEIVNLRGRLMKDNKSILSEHMAEKIIQSGITYNMMLLAHTRDNESGIRAIFSEKVNGVPRVTTLSRVINTLNDFYSTRK